MLKIINNGGEGACSSRVKLQRQVILINHNQHLKQSLWSSKGRSKTNNQNKPGAPKLCTTLFLQDVFPHLKDLAKLCVVWIYVTLKFNITVSPACILELAVCCLWILQSERSMGRGSQLVSHHLAGIIRPDKVFVPGALHYQDQDRCQLQS